MSVVNLHPEELFDKEARGVATAEELQRIALHLSECTTCTLERALKQDFAIELFGEDDNGEAEAHPEDLFDKEARGVATTEELRRIALHRTECAACAFEHAVSLDFAADLDAQGDVESFVLEPKVMLPVVPNEVRPGLESNVIPLVRPEASESSPRAVPLRAPRKRLAWILAAAALLAAGAAGAQGIRHVLTSSGESEAVQHTPSTTESPFASSPRSAGAKSAAPAESASIAEVRDDADVDAASTIEPAAIAPVSAAPRATAPSSPVHPVTAGGPAPATHGGLAPLVSAAALLPPPPSSEMATPTPVPPAPSAPTPKVDTAGDLFSRAASARQSGDVTGALRLYEGLQSTFPNSREARASYVISGRVELDRGHPATALAHFERYVQSGAHELREEALAGRAQSLERLGRPADEARAWTELLAERPTTAYAEHARSRLGKLGAP